jgi:AcrR family transcriptional regulator
MILSSNIELPEPVQPSQLQPLVPATPRGEATRRKLMAAAEAEFGAKGFHIASVSSITTRAGVGQGTFYLYFRTKEEIFVTLVKEIGRSLRKHMRDAVAGAKDRIEAERCAYEAFFHFASTHPGLYRIVQESQFVDPTVYRDYYERIANGYSEDLQIAAARGEIRPGDAEVRAWALMGIGHFLGLRHCLWEGKPPSTEVVDSMMDLVVNGLKK